MADTIYAAAASSFLTFIAPAMTAYIVCLRSLAGTAALTVHDWHAAACGHVARTHLQPCFERVKRVACQRGQGLASCAGLDLEGWVGEKWEVATCQLRRREDNTTSRDRAQQWRRFGHW